MWPSATASAVFAVVVAIWSVADVSFFPPRIESRSLEMATAATHVVVDKPRSTILDLREDTYSLEALSQRAVLLGNVAANGDVRDAIARHANVPSDQLQIEPPLTPDQPRAVVASTDRKHATDLLASTDQYRLTIQANPTVPMLDIYAQAPNSQSAALLANTAVKQLRTYLTELAATERTPKLDQVRLRQLRARRGPSDQREYRHTGGPACLRDRVRDRVRDADRRLAGQERMAG